MFEYVSHKNLPEYFRQAYCLLKPGCLFLNHCVSPYAGTEVERLDFFQKRIFGSGTFLQEFIFPDGELIPISEVKVIAEHTGVEVCDVENLCEHYELTPRHWVNRLEEIRKTAVSVSDEATFGKWKLYMSASTFGFESGVINVNQTLLAKMTPEGKSNMPFSWADFYA